MSEPEAVAVDSTEVIEKLTTGQIEERVFQVAKTGALNGQPGLDELRGFLAVDAALITVRDEKGWTPLLWAAFHGFAQVQGTCSHFIPRCVSSLLHPHGCVLTFETITDIVRIISCAL